MRSREFVMKDAYSFHENQASLEETYWRMHEAYSTIFDRLGLDYRPVEADTGSIGGSHSHEFHMLADSGEDDIAFSTESDFAANVELAEGLMPAAIEAELLRLKSSTHQMQKRSMRSRSTTTFRQRALSRHCLLRMQRGLLSRSFCAVITNSTKSRLKKLLA